MARKKKTSISDIAKALGISVTTVSFILNGKAKEKRISDALTKRVLAYVQKVGYRPSQLVRKPVGRVRVLALLLEDVTDPFYVAVGKQIEKVVSGKGYQLLYLDTANSLDKTRQQLQLCMEKDVDGVLLVPPEGFEDLLSKIKEAMPIVLLERFMPGMDLSYVLSDNRKAVYEVTKRLAEQGAKKIGFVSVYSNQTHFKARLEGYIDAVDEYRLQSFMQKLEGEMSSSEKAGQIVDFLSGHKLDAVLFATADLAINGLNGIKEAGVKLPGIVAFNDHPLFSICTPSVSAIVQDVDALARHASTILLDEIEGKQKESSHFLVPCIWNERDSTRF